MPAEPERFAKLFARPTVEEMHALTPREFERFVAYVLRRAGYDVKEVGPHFLRGVDLEMRLPGKSRIFGGVECKKYAAKSLIPASVVNRVRGVPAVTVAGGPTTLHGRRSTRRSVPPLVNRMPRDHVLYNLSVCSS